MDNIVTTAIVGTGQAGGQGITTHTPIDEMAAQLSCEPERQLLLTAGAVSIYRRAGSVPPSAPAAPTPAEPESIPSCSPKAAQLMNTLLVGEYRALLPEALARMQNAGLRLPYDLLTPALEYGTQTKEMRGTLVSVLGARGRWLSQFNTAWSWVSQYLAETTQTLPDDAETIWQEGTQQQQRTEILRRLRMIDPARARDWLGTVWKQEKAEARNDFLATFEINLSLADEPLLEQALDDRSSKVGSTAARLLSRLPGSALAQRMEARADTMISYTGNELIITLPEKINKEWERDGIPANTSHHKGKRTSWMMEVLAQVSPQHWETRFGATPQQLIDATDNTEWKWEIIESWSNAAILHNSVNWIAPLLDWWYTSPLDARQKTSAKSIKAGLLSSLPQKEAEQKTLQMRENEAEWMLALSSLPQPWSDEFGHACLHIVRDYLHALRKDSRYDYEWIHLLQMMVTALPPSCFASALQSWELPPEATSWIIPHWQKELSAFEIQIGIRKRILEEIK